MFQKIGLVLLLSISLVTTAHAQSLDGRYRGTLHFIKEEVFRSDAQPCPRVGSRRPIQFEVTQSVITIRDIDALVFTGNVAADGSFKITTSTVGRARGGARRFYEWVGTIKGSEISGNYTVGGIGGRCYAEFTARK